MTDGLPAIVEADAQGRWLAWQARGAAADRRRAARMRVVLLVTCVALAAWIAVGLA